MGIESKPKGKTAARMQRALPDNHIRRIKGKESQLMAKKIRKSILMQRHWPKPSSKTTSKNKTKFV